MRLAIPLAVALLGLPAIAQQVTDDEKKEGFRALFDGKTFEGWKTSEKTPSSWKIEEGLLVLTGGRSHLFTAQDYEDFVVRFEWRAKMDGYNSGFFVRGKQIQMAQRSVGLLLGSKNTKGVLELHKPTGEWNQWEVSCAGQKLALKVNGKEAWAIEDFAAKAGPIGIEAEGHPLDFRNLRVRPIEKKP